MKFTALNSVAVKTATTTTAREKKKKMLKETTSNLCYHSFNCVYEPNDNCAISCFLPANAHYVLRRLPLLSACRPPRIFVHTRDEFIFGE